MHVSVPMLLPQTQTRVALPVICSHSIWHDSFISVIIICWLLVVFVWWMTFPRIQLKAPWGQYLCFVYCCIPRPLTQCLANNRKSINMCWMNGLIRHWSRVFIITLSLHVTIELEDVLLCQKVRCWMEEFNVF